MPKASCKFLILSALLSLCGISPLFAQKPEAKLKPSARGSGAKQAKRAAPKQARPDASKQAPAVKIAPAPLAKSEGRASDPGGPLGLAALTEMALANSAELEAARTRLRVAVAKKGTVWEIRDPELRLGYSFDDPFTDEIGGDRIRPGVSAGVRLRLYPPNPWEMRAKLFTALQEISHAEFQLGLLRRRLAMDVRRLYAALQFGQERISLAEGEYRVETDEYERVKKLRDAGTLKNPDVSPRMVDSLRRKSASATDRAKHSLAKADLAGLAGLSDPSRIVVRGVPIPPLVEFRDDSLSVLSEMAFLSSVEISELALKDRRAQGELKALNARKIPWFAYIELGGGQEFQSDNRHNYTPSERRSETFGIQVSLTLPIFTLFSKETEVHREEIRGARAETALRKAVLEKQVAGAMARIQAAGASLSDFDRATVEVTKSLGTLPEDDLATPYHRRLVDVQRRQDRVEVERDYYLAILELERLIGMDLIEAFDRKPEPAAKPE